MSRMVGFVLSTTGAAALLAAGAAGDGTRTEQAMRVAIDALPGSEGIYRIPYADGTQVKVSRDHNTHTPKGRYDMRGTGGSKPYKIVAAAAGTVVAIEDGFSERQDSSTATQCNNNYVWIEHPNGEWTKYSHMTKGSARGKAKLAVGRKVEAGQYIGDEGAVGCASGDHLHFEVGEPLATDPITTAGGFLRDNKGSKRNRIARICGAPKGVFVAQESYSARPVPGAIAPGAKEVARHGLPIGDYQCLFDQAAAAGYEPAWLDMFDTGGKAYVNAIFRPGTSGAVRAYHGLKGAAYQQQFDKWTKQGYRPVVIESYRDAGVRYAAVFKKASGPAYAAYHALSAQQHQDKLKSLTAQGYRPVAISVVSSGGRKYTGLYVKADVGGWELKSQVAPADYQKLYDSNARAGRNVSYLNAYSDGGKPYLVAIFTAKTPDGGKQRHGLTGAQYQAEWSSAVQGGLLTRAVAGYEAGGGARYAASWRK